MSDPNLRPPSNLNLGLQGGNNINTDSDTASEDNQADDVAVHANVADAGNIDNANPPAEVVPDQSRIDAGNRRKWEGRFLSTLPTLANIGVNMGQVFSSHIGAILPAVTAITFLSSCVLVDVGCLRSNDGVDDAVRERMIPELNAIQDPDQRDAHANRTLEEAKNKEADIHATMAFSNIITSIISLVIILYQDNNA